MASDELSPSEISPRNIYHFTEQELRYLIKAIEDSVFDNCEIEITGERTCNTEAFLRKSGINAEQIILWLNTCEICGKKARTTPFTTDKGVRFVCEDCEIKMQKLSLEGDDELE